MKKTIALTAAALVGLVVLAKVTGAGSYASTLLSQAKTAVKDSVPTKFDIERIRHEIASLDQDLDRIIDPIAKNSVAVKRLQEEIARDEKNVADQRKILLDATAAVKSGKEKLWFADKCYPVAQVKQKIAEEFKTFTKREKILEARKTELAAKETALKASQEQLQSFVSKKKEFEVILAQLEADHELNLLAAIGTDVKIDDTRAALIAKDLDDLRAKVDAQKESLAMKQGLTALHGIRLDQPQAVPGPDFDAIQAHLEGRTTPDLKTASNK